MTGNGLQVNPTCVTDGHGTGEVVRSCRSAGLAPDPLKPPLDPTGGGGSGEDALGEWPRVGWDFRSREGVGEG